ncbi:MAG TPA: VWA domain-containing protein [Lacipirellulaceae bacterium]|nr:VWA domain-containing protein [Lacipirellulaceae bacterium]
MQLERVTSGSGQATLAGWISSNDVTLFTTVLVMAIAMFLHAKLTRGAKENVQVHQVNDALTQRLKATTGELDASKDLFNQTQRKLTLTQEQRDQLRNQLVDKLSALAALNTKLDTLLNEKNLLESRQRSLISTRDSLSKEKTELLTLQASLIGARDSLKSRNVDLRQQLEMISSQLADKVTALEKAEQERARLKKQADELDAIVGGLKRRLERMNVNLAELKASADADRADSQTKIQKLQSQLAQSDKTTEEYLAKLRRATDQFQSLNFEKQQLERRLTKAELDHQAALLQESVNNRELVGLTGRLDRVAVLFDASGSMRQASTSGVGDRWAEAQDIAATWLKHLNVQQCVLIVFSSDVRVFPEDGSLADLRGDDGQLKRELLLQHVKQLVPGGQTDTYDALRKAYQYNVDAILLFSDGAPSSSTTGAFDPAVAQQIYELCRTHPDVPVHTIGLGNYFDHDASTFLQSVAKITGGTFRGR